MDTKENIGSTAWKDLTRDEKHAFIAMQNDYGLYNLEAEQALIGSLLTNNEAIWYIPFIESWHFYHEYHQLIFQAINDMARDGRTATPVTLKQYFESIDMLEDIGDTSYLAKLVGASSANMNIKDFADIIIDLAKRRKLQHVMRDAACDLRKTHWNSNAEEIFAKLVSEVMSLDDDSSKTRIETWEQVTAQVVQDFMDESPAISTGIDILDTILGGGLRPQLTYYFQARMKVGKTTLLTTLFHNVVTGYGGNDPVPAMYICAEMGRKQIHQRNMARIAGYSSSAFSAKQGHSNFTKAIQEQLLVSRDVKAYFYDSPGIKFDTLRHVCLAAVKRYGIKGFFLDYFSLVRPSRKSKGFNKVEFYEEVCEWISNFCKEYGVWCVSAAQTNRDGFVRGGDAPVMYGDYVGELHRDEDRNLAYIATKAIRHGERIDAGSAKEPRLRFHYNGPHFKDTEDLADKHKETY